MGLGGIRRRSSSSVDGSRERRIQRGGFFRGLQGKREGEVVGIFFFTRISHYVSISIFFLLLQHILMRREFGIRV